MSSKKDFECVHAEFVVRLERECSLAWSMLQEQKRLELEEMNRVLAELGIETPAAESTAKAETKGAPLATIRLHSRTDKASQAIIPHGTAKLGLLAS